MKNELNPARIVDFLLKHEGMKFSASHLANNFVVSTIKIRQLINQLGATITTDNSSKQVLYYVPTAFQLAANEKLKSRELKPFKAYVMPVSMTQARDRAKELYDEDHGFKSVA